MSNSSANVDTKCPYYLNETEQSITCEGITKETKNVMRFTNKRSKGEYQEKNCNYYPNGCALAKILNDKYK